MLRQSLPLVRSLGIGRVLLTCDDNPGSIRVIETSGGVLENIVRDEGMTVGKRSYWIEVAR